MTEPEEMQPGYLWGSNQDEPIIVGPHNKWHFRAQEGVKLPYWSLWNGGKEIGLHIFPIHEMKDWPDVLYQMLSGLNRGLEN